MTATSSTKLPNLPDAVSIQRHLASFITGTSIGDLPAEVINTARLAIADTFATIVAGTRSELAPALFAYLATDDVVGRNLVFGSDLRVSSERAAMVNATLGHALDYDDVVSAMPGHPSAIIIPALLACAPEAGIDGASVLVAYVVGFEIATKMGMAMGPEHYVNGWHSTGTLGIFGACAAVASMLGFDESQTMMALGIAASMAAGIRMNFGTMTKPLHSGWASSAGVVAARLAAGGFTSSLVALDGVDGFFGVYRGDAAKARDVLLSSLGSSFTMIEPGMSLKKYPCCFALHRAIDALVGLREEGLLGPSARAIEAVVAPGSLLPLPYKRPETGLEAKFSMEYVLAAGALGDDFGLRTFTDSAVSRTEIRELLERTSATEDLRMSDGDPRGQQRSAGTRGRVEVRVVSADGRSSERVVTTPPGSPSRPLAWADVAHKFMDCAAFAGLDAKVAEQALSHIQGLVSLSDVSQLTALFGTSSLSLTPLGAQLMEENASPVADDDGI